MLLATVSERPISFELTYSKLTWLWSLKTLKIRKRWCNPYELHATRRIPDNPGCILVHLSLSLYKLPIIISLGDPLEVNSQYSQNLQYFDPNQVQNIFIYVPFCHLVSKCDTHMFIKMLTSFSSEPYGNQSKGHISPFLLNFSRKNV